MAFDYAVIVAGRVTSVVEDAVSIPASDATTYYHEIRAGETLPSVDDYFTEPCNLFSADPPVIPPGDIAPPFPPGTTPPDPGDVDYPDYDDPVNDVGPTPPPVVVPSLVTFHANDVDTFTATVPSARTALANLLQTAFDFTQVCSFRLQAWIGTAVAGRLACEWYNETALAWQTMDGGAFGPVLDVSTAGYARGDWQSPSAALALQGDAILRLVAESGADGALVCGNVGLLVLSNSGAGGPCVAIPPWTPPGCAVAAGLQSEDFSSYADIAAFYTARGDDADLTGLFSIWYGTTSDSAQTFFDATKLFNGEPALAGLYRAGTTPLQVGSGFWTDLYAAGALDDVTMQMVMELDAGWTTAETSPDTGLQIFSFTSANVVARDSVGLFVRSDRLQLDKRLPGGSYDTTDIGPASLLETDARQLTVRVERSGADIRTRVWIDDPCTTPGTPLHDGTHTARGTGDWESVDKFNSTFSPMPSGAGLYVWLWQISYDTDSTTYGIAA